MKGTFFVKPLEYKVNLEGDEWFQGDSLKGTLKIESHGEADLTNKGVFLAETNIKKLKGKDEAGFKVINKIMSEGASDINFEFDLPLNAMITEKAQSLYILVGEEGSLVEGGALQLSIRPHAMVDGLLEILSNRLRFKVKGLKNKKGLIEATLKAPDSKEFSSIMSSKLLIQYHGETIDLKYQFKVKVVDFTSMSGKGKDEIKEFSQTLGKKDFEIYGSINQDGIHKAMDSILDEVRVKSLI